MQEHDETCCCSPASATSPPPVETDVASQSLADALRLSFRILTGIMIVVLLAFLASGISFVDSQEVAVKKVFGRVVGTSDTRGGLTYTWPYPVGQIEKVRVDERTLDVKDFWVNESAADTLKSLADRSSPSMGLRPGLDGALLAGDRYLLHTNIICKYKIENALAYLSKVAHHNGTQPSGRERDSVLEEMVRTALCNAGIQVAATQTAENIMKNKGQFDAQVLQAAQKQMDLMLPAPNDQAQAVRIISIATKVDWPVRAQTAYSGAQQAKVDFEAKRNEAIREARRTLNTSAGEQFIKLVGLPWDSSVVTDPRLNLIGQYQSARSNLTEAQEQLSQATSPARKAELHKLIARFDAQAEAILVDIDEVLMSNSIGGQASATIADARTWQANYIEGVKGRQRRFSQLLEEYTKSPQLLLERTWADVRDEILDSSLVEKMYVSMSPDGKTIIQIKRDPDIVKRIAREQLKAQPTKGQ